MTYCDAMNKHTLATVDTKDGQCRYVCSCKARGRWVTDLPDAAWSADDRARNAHSYHAMLAASEDRGERPVDWGNA